MARLACNFNFTSSNVFASRQGNRTVLYALGDKLDGVVLAYSIEARETAKYLLYRPPENSDSEKAKLSNVQEEGWNAISILSMDIGGFGFVKEVKKSKFRSIKLESFEDLVKLAIGSPHDEDNTLSQLCCFKDGDGRVAYGIDLVPGLNDDCFTVYYARASSAQKFGFAMYDYKSGKVDFTDSVGEHSYMYLKIINLAERPVFFR